MPKSARSPLSSQDTDQRLSSTHRPASENRPDLAAGGLSGIVQRARLGPGAVSPAEIVALQRVIGMRAVGSLFSGALQRPRVGSAAAPSEGGKGLDGFAIRTPGKADEDEENAPEQSGGKSLTGFLPRHLSVGGRASVEDERARYRQEIAEFQSRNPREAIVARQRDVLDPSGAVGVQTDDHSGTLRRKGKGSAKKGAGKTGTPPVLRKKTVQGPTANDRGGYNWVVQWELDKNSPAGGWIVQGVNVAGNVKDKDDKPLPTGWESYVPYWEAWQVRAGQKVTTYAEGGDVLDDTFANPSYADGSKGEVSETGTPQFYEGLTLPTSFKANGVVPAGILPATKSDPGLTGGSGLIAHEIKAKWDSSKGDDTTTVTTS